VISADWDATVGTLHRHQRVNGSWQPVGTPHAVSLGRAGSAWGLGLHPPQTGPQKREGDGRAPAGLFAIGIAFGYAEQLSTGLDYAAMQASHHCIDVPGSPHYNRIIDTAQLGAAAAEGSTEPMRRDLHLDGDPVYRIGFVIEHNPEAVPSAGSCIFAHLWRAPDAVTAGCTAMESADLEALLAWLDRERTPRFLLLPVASHAALREAWDLPALGGMPEAPELP